MKTSLLSNAFLAAIALAVVLPAVPAESQAMPGGQMSRFRDRGGPDRGDDRGDDRGPPRQRADNGGEQGEVRRERQAGNVRPLRDIEREILPRMGGMQYLGPEYDPAGMSYRLKFIQNGKVHFIDIDARTGRIIGQSR